MKIRTKVITRTVISLHVSVMGINSDDMTEIREFDIPEIETRKILPYVCEICGEDFTPAKVKSVSKVEQLYGMEESVFLQYAYKLPPRTNNNKEQG